ncbi:MAG TPA: chromate resistance protein ChrB domain-containing protein [Dermatophilaceae bacterium]
MGHARPPQDGRIACPWLIRRFIDTDAKIIYVPADQVLMAAAEQWGYSFDAPGARYTHQPSPDGTSEWCTFETLISAHDLGADPALARLAKIVHAADVAADSDTDPLGPGLLAIGVGGLDVEPDDQVLLDRGMFVYDALYAWCVRQVETTSAT